MYEALKSTIPNFDKLHVREIDPKTLIFDPYNSQIRAKGHVTKNVPAMAAVIEQRGGTKHLPPCSVRPLGPDDELKEGATRALAAIQADVDKIRVSDYHFRLYGNNNWEWKKFQAQANEHDDTKQTNTEDDIRKFIADAYNSGDLAIELGFTYQQDPQKFVQQGAKWFKTNIYSTHPKNTNYMRGRLVDATASTMAAAYINYTDATALDHFRKYSGTGCTSTSVGPSGAVNNMSVRLVKNTTRFDPNLAGYALMDELEFPHLKTHVIFWHDNLATITDAQLLAHRIEATNIYDLLATKLTNLGGLWELPQIRGGIQKENPLSIKKVR